MSANELKIQQLEDERHTLVAICCGNYNYAEKFRKIMRERVTPEYLTEALRYNDGTFGVIPYYFEDEPEAEGIDDEECEEEEEKEEEEEVQQRGDDDTDDV